MEIAIIILILRILVTLIIITNFILSILIYCKLKNLTNKIEHLEVAQKNKQKQKS